MSRQGPQKEPTLGNIKAFWDKEAAELGRTPQVTIRDHYFRVHELHALLGILPQASRMLDIGCGTGLGTLALSRRADTIVGADYSVHMIEWANKMISDAAYRHELDAAFFPLTPLPPPPDSISFRQANILDLPDFGEPFDVITGQRILINVPTHEDQLTALRQFRAVAQPGAALVFVEATAQGHARTDTFRRSFGLPALEKYWHNNYVDEDRTGEWRDCGWSVEGTMGFETYVLLSKVVYPAAVGPESCTFLSGTNRAAMECACIARSAAAVDELGISRLLAEFLARVKVYDPGAAAKISSWIEVHQDELTLPRGLGHQRLFFARAI